MTSAIAAQECPRCPFCGEEGAIAHGRVRDGLFGVAGEWMLRRCEADGLVWLDPRPLPEEVPNLYPDTYYTHAERPRTPLLAALREQCERAISAGCFAHPPDAANGALGWAGRILGLVPALRDMAGAEIMWLSSGSPGTLLDVGCGDGLLLARMGRAGWRVLGVDPDPAAARAARERLGVPVIVGDLEGLPPGAGPFDAITLSHVIEHVHDPVGTLRRCWELLRPGGVLAVLTPNVESYGHGLFGSAWPGLDPPRHLVLFSARTLRQCAERAGIAVERIWPVARLAVWTWVTGRALRSGARLRWGGPEHVSLMEHLSGLAFFVFEALVVPSRGEELALIARKPAGSP